MTDKILLAGRPSWHWVLLTLTLFPMFGIIVGQLPAWTWYGELCSHWTLHGAVALLPAMIVFRRDARWGRLLFILLVVALLPWIQAAWSARAVQNGPVIAQATVATANVQFYNTDRKAVQEMLSALDVDLLALQEVTATDETILRANPRWPFQAWSGRADFTRVALLSRQRIVTHRTHSFDGTTVIEALVDLGESPLRVFVVHPLSPGNPAYVERRNRQLAMLAQELDHERHPEPVLVLGDFNLTCGTAMWRSFTGYTGLRRAPGSAPATWPSHAGPFGITIDHILARGATLAPLVRLPIPGSDHIGLRSIVAIPAP